MILLNQSKAAENSRLYKTRICAETRIAPIRTEP